MSLNFFIRQSLKAFVTFFIPIIFLGRISRMVFCVGRKRRQYIQRLMEAVHERGTERLFLAI